ncbi:hypothetical protein BGK60_08300 [Tannerella forsythia]|uniref:hypothetical protein n=1 Tax=Tannerella forsythia TaxID=28112 RepID=UPI0009502F4E|nr:hypothetical protein [Tannerella forsythia]OLQ19731.1 hypothetical protein BGK60_08300 [Tannerella forsythia]
MEAIENIHKALLQLRDSLTHLNSAREQVSQVTAESKEIIDATARLADDVRLLAEKISEETQTVITRFEDRLNESQAGLTGVINEGKELFAAEIAQSQQATTRLKTEVEKTLQQALEATVRTMDTVNASARKTLEEAAAASAASLQELTTVSTDAIEVQQAEISDALESMAEYYSRMQTLIDKLSELDLSGQVLSIEKEIEQIENQQNTLSEELRSEMNKIRKNQFVTWALLLISLFLMFALK